VHDRPAARLAAFVVAIAALTLGVAAAPAAAEPRITPVGTFDTPVHVAAPPGDGTRLFVVERFGRVVVLSGGARKTFLDLTGQVDTEGEEGLLSIAFAPDYATSRRFYVFVAVPDDSLEPGSRLEVIEFLRSASDPDVADPAARRTVIAVPHGLASNHNGGQLQFGPDGVLYVSVGDGGGSNDPTDQGQNTRSLLGKLLRIDPRPGGGGGEAYTVPAGNPFASGAAGAPEVWSYGLRNPWRFSFDRETGDLTVGDVGQGTREEIDFVGRAAGGGAGANFGWRCYEGTISTPNVADCEPPGHVPPVHDYDSNNGFCGVTGGYVVRDPALPTLRGRYLYADLCSPNLRSISLPAAGDDRQEALAPQAPTVSFGEDSCGHVYTASNGGAVNRIDDEPVTPCPLEQPPLVAGQDPPPQQQPPVTADTVAPRLAVGFARRQRLLSNKGVYVAVRCDEDCGVTSEASARLPVAGRTKKWAFPDRSTLAASGARLRLKLKITNATRASLARRMASGARPLVKVVLIARDAAGNETRRLVYVRAIR
jgi:glucose/arabinose dehydrogenase